MSDMFTVCVLTQERKSAPGFLVTKVNLRPGGQYPIPEGMEVLLASGFTSVSPKASFPLSSALQLNHDLARLSPERLHRIALAEFERIQATNYRSYAIEPDSRLCVVAKDHARLHEFVATYGGMVELTPLLLSTTDPSFPTVGELRVTRERDGLRFDYIERAPVDLSRCSYCGHCGEVCPEGCIDEELHIDASRCTVCRQCEQACPQEAIDIDGGEERTLRLPALLILDGAEDLELPADRSGIYDGDALAGYFADQSAVIVDEVISCDPTICQHNRGQRAGCSACLQSCPANALRAGRKGIEVDGLLCVECGSCVAVCPTGAMQYERQRDESFTRAVTALQPEGATVVVGSGKALQRLWWHRPKLPEHTLFLEYPQLGALSLFHLLSLVAAGTRRVVLLPEVDDYQPDAVLKRNIALASSLLNSWFGEGKRIELLALPQLALAEAAAADPVPVLAAAPVGNRRQNLAAMLSHFASASDNQARIKANEALPFATIFCDAERCTQCFACLNVCRIRALATNAQALSLLSTGALCVGCGSCVAVCPENVLQMVRGANLDTTYFQQQLLAEAEPMACRKCGKVFGSVKSYQRVMAILSAREQVDTDHFAYCEDCRVARLFESA